MTIPNSNILAGHTINYTAAATQEGLILHTTVTTVSIGYDVPWPQVHALLLAAARATEGVAATPFVLQTSLDDFYVAYQFNAYTRLPHRRAGLYSQLHEHIQDEFARAGVESISPHYRATRTGAGAGSTIPPAPVRAQAPTVQPQSPPTNWRAATGVGRTRLGIEAAVLCCFYQQLHRLAAGGPQAQPSG